MVVGCWRLAMKRFSFSRRVRAFVFGALPITLLSSLAFGQANSSEGFETLGPTTSGSAGPAELEARGWVFRNQSQPAGPYAYAEVDSWTNPGVYPQAYEGSQYMMAYD